MSSAYISQVSLTTASVVLPQGFVSKAAGAVVTSAPDSLLVAIGNNMIPVALAGIGGFDGTTGLEAEYTSPAFDLPSFTAGDSLPINIQAIYDADANVELTSDTQTFGSTPSGVTVNEVSALPGTGDAAGGAQITISRGDAAAGIRGYSDLTRVRVFVYVDGAKAESDIYEFVGNDLVTANTGNNDTENTDDDWVLNCPFRRVTNVSEGDSMVVNVVVQNEFADSSVYSRTITFTDKPGSASSIVCKNLGMTTIDGASVPTMQVAFTAENHLEVNRDAIKTKITFSASGEDDVIFEKLSSDAGDDAANDNYNHANQYSFDLNISNLNEGTEYSVAVERITETDETSNHMTASTTVTNLHADSLDANDNGVGAFLAASGDNTNYMSMSISDFAVDNREHVLGADNFFSAINSALPSGVTATSYEWTVNGAAGGKTNIGGGDDITAADFGQYAYHLAGFAPTDPNVSPHDANQNIAAQLEVYVTPTADAGHHGAEWVSPYATFSTTFSSPYIPQGDGGVEFNVYNTTGSASATALSQLANQTSSASSATDVVALASWTSGAGSRSFRLTIDGQDKDVTFSSTGALPTTLTYGNAHASGNLDISWREINTTTLNNVAYTAVQADHQEIEDAHGQGDGNFQVVYKPSITVSNVSVSSAQNNDNTNNYEVSWDAVSGALGAHNTGRFVADITVSITNGTDTSTITGADINSTSHTFENNTYIGTIIATVKVMLRNKGAFNILGNALQLSSANNNVTSDVFPDLDAGSSSIISDDANNTANVVLKDLTNGGTALQSIEIILVADNDSGNGNTVTTIHSYNQTALNNKNPLTQQPNDTAYDLTFTGLNSGGNNTGALVFIRNSDGTKILALNWDINQAF